MGVIDDRKVTLGITESSPARVHIDLAACYFAAAANVLGEAPQGTKRLGHELE